MSLSGPEVPTLSSVRELLAGRLAAEPGLVAAWIFGSVARGEARAQSDVDLAILTTSAATGTLLDLRLELRADLVDALGREVDLVVLDRAPADLVHRVLRDGALVLDRDRSVRIAFEVASRNRFFDMSRVWQEYRAGRRARQAG